MTARPPGPVRRVSTGFASAYAPADWGSALALDEDSAYWVDASAHVRGAPKHGGESVLVDKWGQAGETVARDGALYVPTSQGLHRYSRRGIERLNDVVLRSWTGEVSWSGGLRSLSTRRISTGATTGEIGNVRDDSIWCVPLSGGVPTPAVTGTPVDLPFAVGGGEIYWMHDTRIRRVNIDTGDETFVTPAGYDAHRIVLDDTHVYFANRFSVAIFAIQRK